MTPAEMREAAAVLVEGSPWYATASLDLLAAAIRALPLAEEAPPSLAAVLSALPHLTGDELRRVAEAMPRVAGEWVKEPMWTCWRRWRVEMGSTRRVVDVAIVRRHSNGSEWVATTTEPCEYTTHPTAREAQAACDARLEADKVRLCGEVVRDG